MDRNVVEAKLESLRRCVERIAAKTPSSADQLAQNQDLQDIIALNLQRAVQLSVDLASPLIAETAARPPLHDGGEFRGPQEPSAHQSRTQRAHDQSGWIQKHCRS